jgi:hypothetical protein
MNTVAWVLQGVLALIYLFHGVLYSVSPEPLVRSMREQGAWPPAIPDSFRRFIGVAELAAAVGLVVPGLIHFATWLTPLAALGLAIVMVGAAVYHGRRAEYPMVATAIVLLALVVFTGYLRWQVVPL